MLFAKVWKLGYTMVLQELQVFYLKARQIIQYKLGVIVYKCLHGDAPSYLADIISPVGNVSQRQRSAAQGNLTVPPNTESSHGSAELAQH